MAFRVGQKVVCVNDAGFLDPRYFNNPLIAGWDNAIKRGVIYTVCWVGEYTNAIETYVGIRVEGITRRSPAPFSVSRFRPVVEPKQEVSFTHGADPSSDKWDNRKPVKVKA